MVSRLDDTVGLTIGTRARAAQLAAVGAVPSTVLWIDVGGDTVVGDGGQDRYIWRSTASGSYFPDNGFRGGYWVRTSVAAPSTPVYESFADAVAAGAAGTISPLAGSLSTQGYASPGDDGGALYAWQASAPSWAGDDPGNILHFADDSARGGWWVLAEPSPHAAMAGALGDEPGADPTTPCADAINTLSQYLSQQYGGGVIRMGHRVYLADDHIDPQQYTGFVGPLSAARVFTSPGGQEGVEGLAFQPGFVMASGKQIRIADGFFMADWTARRIGIEAHTDLAGALDFQVNGFSGTCVTKRGGGDVVSVTMRNVAFYGFAFGVDLSKANACVIEGIYGDCATLARFKNSGESIRIEGVARKPVLGNNDAIGIEQLTVSALSDDGGFVHFTTVEDPVALGLTDGQRLAADKIPTASTTSQRRTATGVTTTGFTLDDCPWDPAYATWTPEEIADIKFAFAPGQSSAVLTFADDGGFVRVTTQVPFPFEVNHFALLGAPGNAARGFHQIKTVHSTTDFTLNHAWDAGLATIDVTLCELAAMPKNRRHASTVSDWGTTEGYALAVIECDGSYITGRFKGGSGLYCDAANAKIYLSGNEGGAAGEIELNDPDTHGVYVAGARCAIFGMASKSNGTSLTVNLRKASDTFIAVGMELVGDGRALFEQISGSCMLLHCAVRGANQTVLLQDIGNLTIIGGEITPAMIDASNATDDIERVHFIQQPGANSAGNAKTMRHTSYVHEWWTNAGGTLTELLQLDSTAAAFTVPVTAPNLDPATAYTATTTGTTTQALTSAGTAAAGTVSGYAISTNSTGAFKTLVVTAQWASSSSSGSETEAAAWSIPLFFHRASNASSTRMYRLNGNGLTDIPPDFCRDIDLAAVRLDLSLSSQSFVINGDVSGIPSGRNLTWSARLHEVGLPDAAQTITARRFGALADGVTDDRAALQALVDYSSASGRTVTLDDGDYLLGSALYARSNANVVCTPRARLIRDFSQTGTTGLLMNEDMTVAISDFRWSGGVVHNPDPVGLDGNGICLNADDSLVENVFVDEWGANNRAMLLFGDRLVVRGIRATTAYDGGGIKYGGGEDFRCTDCWVEAGDDCFIYGPTGGSSALLFDQSIVRAQFSDCHGYSTNARLICVALLHVGETLHMTASILDSGFTNIRGRCRGFACVQNEDSVGTISRISFIGCHADSDVVNDHPVGSLYISRSSGAGAVEDITFDGCAIIEPKLSAVQVDGVSGYPVGKVTIANSYLGPSRTTANQTVIVSFATSFTLRGTKVVGLDTDVILIGSGSNTATNAVVQGCDIEGITNSNYGLRFNTVVGGMIQGNRFVEASGETTARGISMGSGTSNVALYPNDYTGLTFQEPVVMNATGNLANRIINSGLTSSNATTIRTHQGGQTRTNGNASTSQTYTLPPAVQGQRHTFTQVGTGAMVVKADGSDTIRIGGSVTTATTGSLTSTAQGDSVTVEAVSSSSWHATSYIGTWTVA